MTMEDTFSKQEQKMNKEQMSAGLQALLDGGATKEDLQAVLSTLQEKGQIEQPAEMAQEKSGEGISAPTVEKIAEAVPLPSAETPEQQQANVDAKKAEIDAKFEEFKFSLTPEGSEKSLRNKCLTSYREMKAALTEFFTEKNQKAWKYANENLPYGTFPKGQGDIDRIIAKPLDEKFGQSWQYAEGPGGEYSDKRVENWTKAEQEMRDLNEKIKERIEKAFKGSGESPDETLRRKHLI